MSKYKNINSSIIYFVLTTTLDVSSIGTHTYLLVLMIYYSIIRLYCLQSIVLGIILMNLTQAMSLPEYGTVWYQPGGIVNILSSAWVCSQGYLVTY